MCVCFRDLRAALDTLGQFWTLLWTAKTSGQLWTLLWTVETACGLLKKQSAGLRVTFSRQDQVSGMRFAFSCEDQESEKTELLYPTQQTGINDACGRSGRCHVLCCLCGCCSFPSTKPRPLLPSWCGILHAQARKSSYRQCFYSRFQALDASLGCSA